MKKKLKEDSTIKERNANEMKWKKKKKENVRYPFNKRKGSIKTKESSENYIKYSVSDWSAGYRMLPSMW